MLVQHLRHPLEKIDVRPGFWGLEWSCPSPWEVPEGIKFQCFSGGVPMPLMVRMEAGKICGMEHAFWCILAPWDELL